MSLPQIPWDELLAQYPPDLVHVVRQLFERGGPFETSDAEVSAEISCSAGIARLLLTRISPPLTARIALVCGSCGAEIPDDEQDGQYCPTCEHSITEPGTTREKHLFSFTAPRTRDVRWVLALHGMNTQGAWQEELNWRVATAYGRSVPVAIYKYGIVRPGALSRWYLQKLVQSVIAKFERLEGQTEVGGLGGPPDVIAHSLGTWLISHALLRNPSLRIGRVVLVGSILRPDFAWSNLIAKGQVEAVLNHYGTRDIWAGVAHYVIPDSGPSGRIGFLGEEPIVQVRAEGFGHSDFFTRNNLPRVFENTWHPFITVAQVELPALTARGDTQWSETQWPFRATLLPFILGLVWWLCIFCAIFCLGLGIHRSFQILMH